MNKKKKKYQINNESKKKNQNEHIILKSELVLALIKNDLYPKYNQNYRIRQRISDMLYVRGNYFPLI